MAIYEAQLPATTRMHGWLRFAIIVFVISGIDLGYIFEIRFLFGKVYDPIQNIKLACSQQKKMSIPFWGTRFSFY